MEADLTEPGVYFTGGRSLAWLYSPMEASSVLINRARCVADVFQLIYTGRFHCRSTEPGAWQIIIDDNGNDALQHGGVYVLYESTTPQERYTSPTPQPALAHLMQLLVYCHSARFVLVYCSGAS